jgi:cell division protein ZipA
MMQTNWSLVLNILLLIGVVSAIWRLMNMRKQSFALGAIKPAVARTQKSLYEGQDDIIAVRKVNQDRLMTEPLSTDILEQASINPRASTSEPLLGVDDDALEVSLSKQEPPRNSADAAASSLFMMFLMAKEKRHFAGYELLQTILSCGLRFGEGHLFHRHKLSNGQGPVLCSLAAATASGVFDLQNIGAFSVRGLCLFMAPSNNSEIDAERFTVMLETARLLSEGLHADVLDAEQKPLTEERLKYYYQALNIPQEDFLV